MSGKKRASQRSQDQSEARRSSEHDAESELTEQQSLGNQAMQAQAAAEHAGATQTEAVDLEAVRAEALPMVERAMIALYTEPRAPERVDKLVQVLEGSRLPADRKAVLVDKLVSEQDAALGVAGAAERWFGGADLDARTAALGSLDAVWDALSNGQPAGEAWRTGDSEVALSATTGSIGERADALMGDLAKDRVGEELGEAIQGFCREVYLIIAWHQDEEEEEEGFEPSPEAEIDG